MVAMFLGKLSKDEKKIIKRLEKNIGTRFWNRETLKSAITHKSYANEKKIPSYRHNERLEFLGDAVLELVVSDTLMEAYPEAPEGDLSKLRASMVNEKTLSWIAKELELGDLLYLGKGEEIGQGREKASLLADAYEAVLGAIYLDRGFRKAYKVVKKHALLLLKQVTSDGFYKDYKTHLQETAQTLFKMVPKYRMTDESGPDHDKTFQVNILISGEVYGTGSGKSKKEAEQNAAREALEKLEKKVG